MHRVVLAAIPISIYTYIVMKLNDYLKEQMKDPKFKNAWERLSADYKFQLANALEGLRISQGLTQEKFAKLVGVKQPHVARSERGNSMPSIGYLLRVSRATKTELSIEFKPTPSH